MTIREVFAKHQLMSIRAASFEFDISQDTLRHRIYKGNLDGYKPEGCRDWFIKKGDIKPIDMRKSNNRFGKQ